MSNFLEQEREWQERALKVQGQAAQAFERLLTMAETSMTGQGERIKRFIASTFDGETWRYDLFELRTFDVAISDDMLTVLDCLRWGKADLWRLVPNGEDRVRKVAVTVSPR